MGRPWILTSSGVRKHLGVQHRSCAQEDCQSWTSTMNPTAAHALSPQPISHVWGVRVWLWPTHMVWQWLWACLWQKQGWDGPTVLPQNRWCLQESSGPAGSKFPHSPSHLLTYVKPHLSFVLLTSSWESRSHLLRWVMASSHPHKNHGFFPSSHLPPFSQFLT